MVLTDRSGLPLAVQVHSASPAEVTLLESLIEKRFLRRLPQRIVADAAYDSDMLDQRLAKRGIDLISPNRQNRRNFTQDRRKLRRYKRRWHVERLNAWLQSFRKITVRYERKTQNFFAFLLLACSIILARRLTN